MTIATHNDGQSTGTIPVKRVIGFADTQSEIDDIIQTLIDSGIHRDRITVMHGDDGQRSFSQTMARFGWGEESQRMAHEGSEELANGHFVMSIEADGREPARNIALCAEQMGGHGFAYFGTIVDERFTS